jgi:hypothetical protein
VDGYTEPTPNNWLSFFLGANEAVADATIEIMNPQPRLLLPTPGERMVEIPNLAQPPQAADAIADRPNTQIPSQCTPTIDVVSTVVNDEEEENIPF